MGPTVLAPSLPVPSSKRAAASEMKGLLSTYPPASSFVSSWFSSTATPKTFGGGHGWRNNQKRVLCDSSNGSAGGSGSGGGIAAAAVGRNNAFDYVGTAVALGGLAHGSINGTVVQPTTVTSSSSEVPHLERWSEKSAVGLALQVKREAEVREEYDKVERRQRAAQKKEEDKAKATWPPPVNLQLQPHPPNAT